VRKLIRKAEDIDADAIISFDYETDSIVPIEGTGLQLKRILATGLAVKLSCAARLNGIAQKVGPTDESRPYANAPTSPDG